MSWFVHIDNQNQNILIIGERPTQGLEDTIYKYPINFAQSGKWFVLSVHYNESNSFLFVNATKIDQFKPKDSEMKHYTLCLGNISKDFTVDNMESRLKRTCESFFCQL